MTTTVLTMVGGARRRASDLAQVARASVVARVPVAAQVLGGLSTVVGAYVLFGLGVTLFAGGLVVTALGSLREAGKI